WIKTFYNNITSSILNNGHATSMLNIHSGVRQGCSLSPYIFIMCAEIFAIVIRNNTNIKPPKIPNFNRKISQFADVSRRNV
ncbi:hypothetical protein LOTGIDRAFT_117854, partial [Lottia gigantea]